MSDDSISDWEEPATADDLAWWLDLAPTLAWTWARTFADFAPHSRRIRSEGAGACVVPSDTRRRGRPASLGGRDALRRLRSRPRLGRGGYPRLHRSASGPRNQRDCWRLGGRTLCVSSVAAGS
jgi:hypothetical protein